MIDTKNNELLNEDEFKQFKSKDKHVFKKVYDEYYALVRHVAARCGAEALNIDDVVQETFIRLYTNTEQIYHQEKLKHWLATTARNICLDQIRKRKVEHKYARRTLNEIQIPPQNDTLQQATFTTQSEIHELELTLVGALIDKVTSETEDETFSLFYCKGLSAKEIAKRQNAPLSTVTNRLSRLRKRFNKHLISHIRQLHENLI